MSIIIPRDRGILYALGRFGALDRKRVGWLCFSGVPRKSRARVTRRRLAALERAGFVRRCQPNVPGSVTPVYCLTEKGREWLEADSCDPSIMGKPTKVIQLAHLHHHLAAVDTHIMVRQAARCNAELFVEQWINEGDVINYHEEDPEKQRTLFTVLSENPKLVCSFDAAMHIRYRGRDAIYGLEQDRNSSSAVHVCKMKMPGVAALADSPNRYDFFPAAQAKGFLVLLVCPKEKRRDRLCEELARNSRPRPDLWRVASLTDLTPETFFHAPVWRTHEKKAVSLLGADDGRETIKLDSVRPPAPTRSSTTAIA